MKRYTIIMVTALEAALFAGCVSMETHKDMLADFAASCRSATLSALGVDRDAERTKEEAASQIQALETEQARLAKNFIVARDQVTHIQTELESARYHLAQEQDARRLVEKKAVELQEQRHALERKLKAMGSRLEATEAQLDEGTEVRAEGRARAALLAEERLRLSNELLSAHTASTHARERLAAVQQKLADEEEGRGEAERRLERAQEKSEQLQRLERELRRERDHLKTGLMDATARLQAAREALVESQWSLAEARTRLAKLEDERNHAKAALSEANSETKRLKAALAAEREIWTGFQEALRKVERTSQPEANSK